MSNDPVAEYKEILDTTRQAANRLAERERRRTLEIGTEILAAEKKIKSATEAEKELNKQIAGWWRQVAVRLVSLNWISPGKPPEPDPAGDPAGLDDYLQRIEPETNALIAALRKAMWPKQLP